VLREGTKEHFGALFYGYRICDIYLMIVLAPISVGELIDKITILELKLFFISDPLKRANVTIEHGHLCSTLELLNLPDITELRTQLYNVNKELWHIENYKRDSEKVKIFGDGFINAARQVYWKNDLRASIKKQINELVGSDIVEEKSY
jgi:hypothetical protein